YSASRRLAGHAGASRQLHARARRVLCAKPGARRAEAALSEGEPAGDESVARVAAHEALVDLDPETGPVRELELAVHHGELLVDELVQQGVRAERVLEDEPGALA